MYVPPTFTHKSTSCHTGYIYLLCIHQLLHIINEFVCVVAAHCVYCVVGTEFYMCSLREFSLQALSKIFMSHILLHWWSQSNQWHDPSNIGLYSPQFVHKKISQNKIKELKYLKPILNRAVMEQSKKSCLSCSSYVTLWVNFQQPCTFRFPHNLNTDTTLTSISVTV